MRTLVIVGLVCAASAASAGPKQKVAILGLEPISTKAAPDKESVAVAQDLTIALRLRVKAGVGTLTFAPGSDRDLVDEKLLASCETEAPVCMSRIGAQLGADVLIYGKLEKRPNGYQVSLRMLDVGTKQIVVSATDLVPTADATGTKLDAFGRKLWNKLDGSRSTTSATAPSTTAANKRPPPTGCDMLDRGDEQVAVGTYAAALVSYEKALACSPTTVAIIARAFMASCKSKNTAKAKLYFGKLPTDKQQAYASICIKQAIDVP